MPRKEIRVVRGNIEVFVYNGRTCVHRTVLKNEILNDEHWKEKSKADRRWGIKTTSRGQMNYSVSSRIMIQQTSFNKKSNQKTVYRTAINTARLTDEFVRV